MIGLIRFAKSAALLFFICQFFLASCGESTESDPSDGDGDMDNVHLDGDMDSVHLDGDADGETPCETLTLSDHSCTWKTEADCLEDGYSALCAHRSCLHLGWQHRCDAESGLCRRHCHVDYGEDSVQGESDYTGVWGGLITFSQYRCDLCIREYRNTLTSYYTLARIRHEGDALLIEHRICAMEIRDFNSERFADPDFQELVYPDAFVDASSLIIHRIENPPPFDTEEEFESNTFAEARGIRLDDPATNEFPNRQEAADDSRVWDADKDGQPGLTLLAKGVLNGEVYVLERIVSSIRASVIEQDRISGVNEFERDTVMIGASNNALIWDDSYSPNPAEQENLYRLERMQEDTSCAELLEAAHAHDSWLNPYSAFEGTVIQGR